jgi:hypothetical protein
MRRARGAVKWGHGRQVRPAPAWAPTRRGAAPDGDVDATVENRGKIYISNPDNPTPAGREPDMQQPSSLDSI